MVVGQSQNRRHLLGTSISKSFLVFYRLTLFNFASLLDRYNKAVQPFPIISVFLFVSSLLDRYGKAVQLYFSFVNNKFNGRYLFRPVDCNSVRVIFRCNESSTPFQARRFKLCHRKLSAFFCSVNSNRFPSISSWPIQIIRPMTYNVCLI